MCIYIYMHTFCDAQKQLAGLSLLSEPPPPMSRVIPSYCWDPRVTGSPNHNRNGMFIYSLYNYIRAGKPHMCGWAIDTSKINIYGK